jgi:hypothetical protein
MYREISVRANSLHCVQEGPQSDGRNFTGSTGIEGDGVGAISKRDGESKGRAKEGRGAIEAGDR